MARWLVGVDAGGTNTRAAAVDAETGERREARAEGANWTVHGPDLCRERIGRAVDEALPPGALPVAVCTAIAGYYPPDHQQAAEPWARETWPESVVRVVPDVAAAWAGAHGGEPGIVVISGTGSIAYGRNAKGQEARAGGWGPLFGDEGSAYWIGIGCLRTLANHVDWRAEPTELSRRLLERWPELGTDLRTWLRGVYREKWGREQIAGLTAEVADLAESDLEVMSLFDSAGYHLADMVSAVAVSLADTSLPLVIEGGLGQQSRKLRASLQECLRYLGRPLPITERKLSPLEGALLLAAEALGGPHEMRAVRERLK